jgi:signal transduction histidine kinase
MRDRLAAVGGELSITSLHAVGTVVRGRVPVSPPA